MSASRDGRYLYTVYTYWKRWTSRCSKVVWGSGKRRQNSAAVGETKGSGSSVHANRKAGTRVPARWPVPAHRVVLTRALAVAAASGESQRLAPNADRDENGNQLGQDDHRDPDPEIVVAIELRGAEDEGKD